MPYDTYLDLPLPVRRALPVKAQQVFRTVFNTAHASGSGEQAALRQAWGVVRRGWQRGGNGKWVKKVGPADEARDERGRWTSEGSGTRLDAKARFARETQAKERFVSAVKQAMTSDMTIKVSNWRSDGPYRALPVTLRLKQQPDAVAQAVLWMESDGTVDAQQHDIDLPANLRGHGYGTQMIDALVAGYRSLGLSNVPIHMNVNPGFWDKMKARHTGVFAKLSKPKRRPKGEVGTHYENNTSRDRRLEYNTAKALYAKDFNPSEPRDEHGRWSSGGAEMHAALQGRTGGRAETTGADLWRDPLYHGTIDKALSTIKKEGLDPEGKQRRTFFASSLYNDERGRSVYLTGDKFNAMQYARERSNDGKLGYPLLLQVSLPPEEAYSLLPDEYDDLSVRYSGRIRPDWISDYAIKGPSGEWKWAGQPLVTKLGGTVYAVLILKKPAAKYDPNEARDQQGRWTSSGGPRGKPVLSPEILASLKALASKIKAYGGPVLYHGTRDQVAAAIMKNGLVPKASAGADTYALGRGADPSIANAGSRGFSVYLTDEPGIASQFADLVTSEHPGSKPIVFGVKMDPEDPNLLTDEAAFTEGHLYRYKGTIPPSKILGYADLPFYGNTIGIANLKKPVTVAKGEKVFYLIVFIDDQPVEKYNPDETRDDHGRWSSDGEGVGTEQAVPKTNSGGNCYDTAGDAILALDGIPGANSPVANLLKQIGANPKDVRLVQAEVTGQGAIAGLRYGHSWLEWDGKVFDFSNGNKVIMPKERYYALGHVIQEKGKYASYTPQQVKEWMVRTKNYGPWQLDTKI